MHLLQRQWAVELLQCIASLSAGVVWCGVVWCGVVWCGVVWCGVVWCGMVWCGVVWCGVVWCGVVWCAEGAVTRRQCPGCLPTGTRKREAYVSWCAPCDSVLLYSRDLCCVALGRYCSADPCARSHRVYGANCTASAVLHQQYFLCGAHCLALCSALHCVCLAALHLWAVGSGQRHLCNVPPLCLRAVGNRAPALHRHIAWRQ